MKITTVMGGAVVVAVDVFDDERGFFMESYNAKKFDELGIAQNFVQDNHSGSKRGTLRGLHYQIKQPQGKLVRAVVGEIFDVAVDLRRSSPSFGQWFGIQLSAENKLQLWVPEGFAHGFYVLSDWAEVLYKTTDFYAAHWERSILWNDPDIGIDWPLIPNTALTVSERDIKGLRLCDAEVFA